MMNDDKQKYNSTYPPAITSFKYYTLEEGKQVTEQKILKSKLLKLMNTDVDTDGISYVQQ